MNTQMLLTAISLLLVGIFSIATSSIAIECYNKEEHKTFKTEKTDNFNFVIVNLVSAIVMVLVSFASIYFAFQQ